MDYEALQYVTMPIVVLERTDRDRFIYVWINKAAASFSGLSLAEIAGRTPREVFPGRAGDQLAARQEAAARRGSAAQYTYPLALPRGEVWIETSLVPVIDVDGKVCRLIATMQDRTAERALQEQNLASETRMKAVESEIERYIAMAAHDLRTPMRHVRQIAGLLREDFVDHGDGKLEMIEMLEDVGVKANELISEVLSFARAGTAEQNRSAVELSELCADIFTVLDPQRRYSMTSDQAVIETDAVALQIALRNLIDNIVKHAGPNGNSVRVQLTGERDGMLVFRVSDNGRGFDDPAIAFLDGGEFKYSSGFGLLGVKRIVCTRGGDIRAEPPEDGVGAQITFTLPGRMTTGDVPLDNTSLITQDRKARPDTNV